jgi:hypothetical protein
VSVISSAFPLPAGHNPGPPPAAGKYFVVGRIIALNRHSGEP